MVLDGIEDLQFDVRKRTDRQGHSLPHQAFDQLRVFLAANAVVDTLYFQEVECLIDVFRRALFARVSDGQQAFAASAVEYGGELRRRVALFQTSPVLRP